VLTALVELGEAKAEEVADAISRYGIDADRPDPRDA
jgi:pyruvate dehydrogenase complex dehydrogenase (E1) component